MDSKKKDIDLQAQRLEQNRNEKVRKIKEHLNSSQNEPTNKDLIQKVQRKISEDFTTMKEHLDKKFFGLCLVFGIMAYFICCFCGQDECYGSVLLAFPFIISKEAFCWTLLKIINLLKKIPCEDDTKLISTPPVVKKKLTELATVFQEEDTQDDLLRFWIPLVLGVLFGILLIGSLIAGLLKWINYQARNNQSLLGINIEGNWVYGSKVQDKAALTAKKGQNLAPVEETK